jgi:hypothetical protein
MGVSTDGILAFDVLCKEGTTLPWDASPFNGDMEEWWLAESGFVPPDAECLAARRKWLKDHPLNISAENYCSGEYPMWAIVLNWTVTRCSRGYPVDVDCDRCRCREDDSHVPAGSVFVLTQFLKKYGIEYDKPPRWILMSYWSG